MPKKLKRVVYDGPAEEMRRDFGSKTVVLKRGIVTTVDDDVFEYLKSCRKKMQISVVEGIEEPYHKKLKDRLIKEEI